MSRLAEALMPSAFDGSTYEPARDGARLSRQLTKVRNLMLDGKWRTLGEIAVECEIPEQSASARLRDCRKNKFGGYRVDREPVPGQRGLYRYRVSA